MYVNNDRHPRRNTDRLCAWRNEGGRGINIKYTMDVSNVGTERVHEIKQRKTNYND